MSKLSPLLSLSTNVEQRERDLALLGEELTAAMSGCTNLFRDVKIRVDPSPSGHQLGLLATKPL